MCDHEKCIIQPLNYRFSILYSYMTGKYYLYDTARLPFSRKGSLASIREKLFIKSSEAKYIINNAINPNSIDVTSFSSPVVIGIMVSNYCNLKCKYCISANGKGYSEKNTLMKNWDSLVNNLSHSQVVSVVVSGGEPTLFTKLPELLDGLAQRNFYCMVDTNGAFINDDVLNTLARTDITPRVSLDSVLEYEHNCNRGYFKETMSNILTMIKKKIPIRVNTVLNSMNINNLNLLADWLIFNGVNKWHIYKLQKEFAPHELWLDDVEVDNKISFLQNNYGNSINILCKFSRTNDSFSSFIIDSEGNCFSTNNDNNLSEAKTIFGNILVDEISTIWLSLPINYRLRHYNKFLSWPEKRV